VSLLSAALVALLVACPWSDDDGDGGRREAPAAPAVTVAAADDAPSRVITGVARGGDDEARVVTAADTDARRVVALTNAARADAGCRPLTETAALDAYATDWATRMAGGVGLVHSRLGGIVWAENIARGQDTADEVVADWLASPGHRRNILDCSYATIGVAHVGEYWSQNFGRG
jgi:uncharacterized protein YkwD